ncbi:hypothetical protein FUAX_21170 [Fulvitalea axinellae]|uniref:Uncharacterized protein n=1 Tax=Fulvitalea axinellae TaxID=1182444 RepID=A0AAU9DFE0_9BACT|nr:hypothetical protein FUAX_21170 [Fulvitalea axinellae]
MNRKTFRTLEKIFQRPMDGELPWYAVEGMFHSLGARIHEKDVRKDMKDMRQVSVIYDRDDFQLEHPANEKLMEGADLQKIREFLLRHDVHPDHETMAEFTESTVELDDCKIVVVCAGHESKVYRLGNENNAICLEPRDWDGFRRRQHHKKTEADFQPEHFKGQQAPKDPYFFERLAECVSDADELLVVGHGDGHSNEAREFMAYLKEHKPQQAKNLVGFMRMGDSSEKALLEKAKAIFGIVPPRKLPER